MTADEIKAANEALITNYRLCFGSPAGQVVLGDLMRLCCFRTDVRSETDEGKRRVFLRIVNMMQLTDEQLYSLYAGRNTGVSNV